MFSYRHGFHAGNHADVLKHITLLNTLRLLHKKDTGLMLIDTHAGGGLYALNSRFAATSQESSEGVLKLVQAQTIHPLSLGIQEYLKCIQDLQKDSAHLETYPGSPFYSSRKTTRYSSHHEKRLYASKGFPTASI